MYREKQMYNKTVSIAPNRQITIPKKIYETLGFRNEAECYVVGNTVVLKPRNHAPSGEFDEFILRDLIEEGYNGEELLEKFKETRGKIRPAFEKMAENLTQESKDSNGVEDYKEFFGEDYRK
jgi:bifunctional DNA-binding transcriptional regulator/antitoxin component of YhaV-PrlF toxin-antitoxin module